MVLSFLSGYLEEMIIKGRPHIGWDSYSLASIVALIAFDKKNLANMKPLAKRSTYLFDCFQFRKFK